MVEHLDVSGGTSLMERSLQNPGTSVVHIDVAQICCVPDDVFMITPIKTWRKNVAVHTAIGQNSCERDHESGILEPSSFTGMLYNDN